MSLARQNFRLCSTCLLKPMKWRIAPVSTTASTTIPAIASTFFQALDFFFSSAGGASAAISSVTSTVSPCVTSSTGSANSLPQTEQTVAPSSSSAKQYLQIILFPLSPGKRGNSYIVYHGSEIIARQFPKC